MPPEEQNQSAPNASTPPVPPPGPPKKGFWGFIADLFPKRPEKLNPPTPTGEVKAGDNEPSQQSESAPQQTQPQQTQPAPTPPMPEPGMEQDSSDQDTATTNEEASQNTEGESTPPTLDVPQDVKAQGPEENEGNSPEIPSEPPASGGSAEDPSSDGQGDQSAPSSGQQQ